MRAADGQIWRQILVDKDAANVRELELGAGTRAMFASTPPPEVDGTQHVSC